jgi:hypothetical protein
MAALRLGAPFKGNSAESALFTQCQPERAIYVQGGCAIIKSQAGFCPAPI